MTTAQEKKHTHENLKFLEMSAHTMGGGRKKKNFSKEKWLAQNGKKNSSNKHEEREK
jgi:hypothetical protein